MRLELTGAVQGVGFRPFVHRLATELNLCGWVKNSFNGVAIEIEGVKAKTSEFLKRLENDIPPHAWIAGVSNTRIPAEDASGFLIADSTSFTSRGGGSRAEILPDLATCQECLRELFDPADRRFNYPFINCTHCGPRFSIVLALPYDRCHTTMHSFVMCAICRAEYESPMNRRFHAQPNACPDCGPRLSWLDQDGVLQADRETALECCASALEKGQIVAVKGIGGFHLFTDARDAEAIARLRKRKRRSAKPFALMMPTITAARREVAISDQEAAWLTSTAAPIVILPRTAGATLPESLAPGNPQLGIMLPYSPLHHLLVRRLGFPVVATSGNLGDEPICIDNDEAVVRLGGIADGFLVHDRSIARPVDDSVMRLTAGREMLLRRSRGYVPASIRAEGIVQPVLAFGGDLKSTIAIAADDRIQLSQHFGDLASLESHRVFQRHLENFPQLCGVQPEVIACDRHPSYHSRQLAETSRRQIVAVQHHHAHAAACAAENGVPPGEEFFAVVWDGTGYGDDGTIWGGEFLCCSGTEFKRFAWMRPFTLPGGEKAVRDPRFSAVGCLHEAEIPLDETPLIELLTGEERRIAETLMERKFQAPRTSSVGRLFDAVSALCGLALSNSFEGQAAMALEFAALADPGLSGYRIDDIVVAAAREIDWRPLLHAVVDDLAKRTPRNRIALRFQLALADLILKSARAAGIFTVALSGGCFQNALLTRLSVEKLRESGFHAIWHRQVPPNDGGLAFGQAVVAGRAMLTHHH